MTHNADISPTQIASTMRYERLRGPLGWIRGATTKKRLATVIAGVGFVSAVIGIVAFVQGQVSGPQGSIATPSVLNRPYCPPSDSMPQRGSGTVYVSTEVEDADEHACWAHFLAPVAPGAIVKVLITYFDVSNAVQNQVIVRVITSPEIHLLSQTTWVSDASNPNGIHIDDAGGNIAGGGLNLGNFGTMANAYVTFDLQLPPEPQLRCGSNSFDIKGVATPKGTDGYYNLGQLEVYRNC